MERACCCSWKAECLPTSRPHKNSVCWCSPVVAALGAWRQEDQFKVVLGFKGTGWGIKDVGTREKKHLSHVTGSSQTAKGVPG